MNKSFKTSGVIALLNNSGNVGKSTLSVHCFLPRMANALYIPVESINVGSNVHLANQEKAPPLSAEKTAEILNQVLEVMCERPVLLDIGSSNIEVFTRQLMKMEEVLVAISTVVVPCVPNEKVIADTLNTIDRLVEEMGYPANQIWVVGNMMPANAKVEESFADIIRRSQIQGFNFVSDVIELDDAFEVAEKMRKSLYEAAHEESYLKQLMSGQVARDDRKKIAALATFQSRAKGISKTMDSIFEQIVQA